VTSERAGGFDPDALARGVDRPARQDNVLRLQRIDDRLRRDAKAGQPGVRRGQEDTLRLHAEQLDPLDTGKTVQSPARIPGDAAHLLQREAIAPQRDCGERGQTELVIDERSVRARQLRHRIAHLVAQHLPDALDSGPVTQSSTST
jgi:hypothetical protein